MEKRGFLKMSVFSLSLSLSLMWEYTERRRKRGENDINVRQKKRRDGHWSERASEPRRKKQGGDFFPSSHILHYVFSLFSLVFQIRLIVLMAFCANNIPARTEREKRRAITIKWNPSNLSLTQREREKDFMVSTDVVRDTIASAVCGHYYHYYYRHFTAATRDVGNGINERKKTNDFWSIRTIPPRNQDTDFWDRFICHRPLQFGQSWCFHCEKCIN